MSKVWVVRAGGGTLADDFLDGGFASIGWEMGDLTEVKDLDALRDSYRAVHPEQFPPAAGNVVAQIHAFMNQIASGDIIVTPTINANVHRFGEVIEQEPYAPVSADAHHHVNRRKVHWRDDCILRTQLPDAERKTLRDRRTVFLLSDDRDAFLSLPAIGLPCDAPFPGNAAQAAILARIHQKNPGFFELLIAELLQAMGCTDLDVRGGPGDQGVDVAAHIQIPFADTVKVHVQAKRYQPGRDIDMRAVKKLNHGLPDAGRGLLITTSGFKPHVPARSAEETPSVFLIDGPTFAEQLFDHWQEIPQYFRDQLGPLSE
ncbi:MAG: DUF2034 domain-containing protein [Chloroflexota bacterium]|nr:DUF2034 domain-containing protein [Chloroflexota bacterium]